MKKNIRVSAAMAIAFFAVTLAGQQSNAQSFGVSFVDNNNVNVTGPAGVISIDNWNNINSTYTTGSILADDGFNTATLTMSGSAGQWHSGGTTIDGGNGSLMDGYRDYGSGGGGTSVISGLTGSSYSVYLYAYGDVTRPGNGGDWLPNYSVNGTTYYAAMLGSGTSTFNTTATTVGGAFSGFVQATTFGANFNTATMLATDFGNYIRIDNVTPISGAITIVAEANTQTWRSPLNGIEIVPCLNRQRQHEQNQNCEHEDSHY